MSLSHYYLRANASVAAASSSPPLAGSNSNLLHICGDGGEEGRAGVYLIVEACIKAGAVIVVLLYMYYKKRITLYPTSSAATEASLIFPFYYSLFFATAAVDILTVILSVCDVLFTCMYAFINHPLSSHITQVSFGGQLPPAIAAICWSLSRLITEGLAIFLLHHGVGIATIQHSFLYAVMWALVSFIAWYFIPILRETKDTNTVGNVLAMLYLTPPLCFYLLLALAPMKYLPR